MSFSETVYFIGILFLISLAVFVIPSECFVKEIRRTIARSFELILGVEFDCVKHPVLDKVRILAIIT